MSSPQLPLDLALPDVEVAPDPMADLSADARRTLRARTAIANGRHPFGPPLLDGTETCRSCAYAHRVSGGARWYWKCDATRGSTRGAASDLRLHWPACVRWEARDDG